MIAPAWRDAPICAGRWINANGRSVDIVDPERDVIGLDLTVRWYGPIPKDVQ